MDLALLQYYRQSPVDVAHLLLQDTQTPMSHYLVRVLYARDWSPRPPHAIPGAEG